MTQPIQQQKPSWVQDVIDKYTGDKQQRQERPQYRPSQVEFDRAPFDPSDYYSGLQSLRNFSKAGTRHYTERIAQQKLQEQRSQIENLRKRLGQPASAGVAGGTPSEYGKPLSGGSISSGYGHRDKPIAGATSYHQGIDFAAPEGTPIYATHSGVVTNSGWSDGYGYNISIAGGGGVETFYGHNSKNEVKNGQYVEKGQVIGYVGSTGVSTGPHLHYGVRVNGQWINPKGYYG